MIVIPSHPSSQTCCQGFQSVPKVAILRHSPHLTSPHLTSPGQDSCPYLPCPALHHVPKITSVDRSRCRSLCPGSGSGPTGMLSRIHTRTSTHLGDKVTITLIIVMMLDGGPFHSDFTAQAFSSQVTTESPVETDHVYRCFSLASCHTLDPIHSVLKLRAELLRLAQTTVPAISLPSRQFRTQAAFPLILQQQHRFVRLNSYNHSYCRLSPFIRARLPMQA